MSLSWLAKRLNKAAKEDGKLTSSKQLGGLSVKVKNTQQFLFSLLSHLHDSERLNHNNFWV